MAEYFDHCPYCKTHVDRHSDAHGSIPEPGNLSVCLYCSRLSVFDENIKLRKPTSEEINQYKADPELWRQVSAYVMVTHELNQPQ